MEESSPKINKNQRISVEESRICIYGNFIGELKLNSSLLTVFTVTFTFSKALHIN